MSKNDHIKYFFFIVPNSKIVKKSFLGVTLIGT